MNECFIRPFIVYSLECLSLNPILFIADFVNSSFARRLKGSRKKKSLRQDSIGLFVVCLALRIRTLQVLLSAVTSISATRQDSYWLFYFRPLSCNVVMFVLDESDASSFLDWLSYYLD
jgi:hypothetical protein